MRRKFGRGCIRVCGKVQSAINLIIGDYVRLTSHRNIFRKGYEVRWTEEIFRVRDRLKKERNLYYLEDLKQEPIQGSFYGEELQRVERSSDIHY